MTDQHIIDAIKEGLLDGNDLDATYQSRAEAVLRALRANGLVVGKVKPLEWSNLGRERAADTPIGEAVIRATGPCFIAWGPTDDGEGKPFETEAEAKTWLDQRHAELIRECIQ